MKIVFISDDGARHKKVSLQYGLQYILPFLFITLFLFSLLFINNYLYGFNSQAREKIAEYNDLPNSSVETINFHLLNKRIAELNDSVRYLAKQNNFDVDTLGTERETSSLSPVNYDHRLRDDYGMKQVETLEQSIKVQETNLRLIMSHLELKQLEDQALEIYTDKSNRVQLISDFIMPVSNGNTTSRYGLRKDPINGAHRNHRGIDVAAPTGTSIKSIANGFVTFIGRRGGYGKVIEITHSDSLKSRYAHLDSYNVSMGKVVIKGDKIGEVGSTGRVTGPHLHLEVWKKGTTVDPFNYLSGIKYVDN